MTLPLKPTGWGFLKTSTCSPSLPFIPPSPQAYWLLRPTSGVGLPPQLTNLMRIICKNTDTCPWSAGVSFSRQVDISQLRNIWAEILNGALTTEFLLFLASLCSHLFLSPGFPSEYVFLECPIRPQRKGLRHLWVFAFEQSFSWLWDPLYASAEFPHTYLGEHSSVRQATCLTCLCLISLHTK